MKRRRGGRGLAFRSSHELRLGRQCSIGAGGENLQIKALRFADARIEEHVDLFGTGKAHNGTCRVYGVLCQGKVRTRIAASRIPPSLAPENSGANRWE